jgi:hypothetical protein
MTSLAEPDVVRLYRARETPELVEVPEFSFLMVDGRGDPNTSTRFQEAVQALYSVSYGLKFQLKRANGVDYRVSPLEGLWWSDDLTCFVNEDKSSYEWTLMIRQPQEVTPALLVETVAAVEQKKRRPALPDLRLEPFAEGLAAQVLHLGPYAAEGPTIENLHAFIPERGLSFDGHTQKHHEIYLGDPRRSAPERLKTIIRQPVSHA